MFNTPTSHLVWHVRTWLWSVRLSGWATLQVKRGIHTYAGNPSPQDLPCTFITSEFLSWASTNWYAVVLLEAVLHATSSILCSMICIHASYIREAQEDLCCLCSQGGSPLPMLRKADPFILYSPRGWSLCNLSPPFWSLTLELLPPSKVPHPSTSWFSPWGCCRSSHFPSFPSHQPSLVGSRKPFLVACEVNLSS